MHKNSEKSAKMLRFSKKKYPPFLAGFRHGFGRISPKNPTHQSFLFEKKGVFRGVFLRAEVVSFFLVFPSRFICKRPVYSEF